MEYDLSEIKTIPVIVCPTENQCKRIYPQSFIKENILVFPYEPQRLRTEIFKDAESPKAFIYRVTFSLLAYTCLKLLLEKQRLFIPIVRLQINDKANATQEEDFMRSLFFSIAHLLNENHHSNSQGFCVKSINSHKVRNGLTSLYSVLRILESLFLTIVPILASLINQQLL